MRLASALLSPPGRYAASGGRPIKLSLNLGCCARGFAPPRQARFRLRKRDVPLAPSAGWSGLPKEPAFAADTVIAALMADTANTSREQGRIPSTLTGSRQSMGRPMVASHFKKNRQAPFSSLFASEKTGALFRMHDRLRDALGCLRLAL